MNDQYLLAHVRWFLWDVIAEAGVHEVVRRLWSAANARPSIAGQIAVGQTVLEPSSGTGVEAIDPPGRSLNQDSSGTEAGACPRGVTRSGGRGGLDVTTGIAGTWRGVTNESSGTAAVISPLHIFRASIPKDVEPFVGVEFQ